MKWAPRDAVLRRRAVNRARVRRGEKPLPELLERPPKRRRRATDADGVA